MSLASDLRARVVLPAICAPMMLVSGPELVGAAARAGIMAGLPRHNARTAEEFEGWLEALHRDLSTFRSAHPEARVGPVAANIIAGRPLAETIPDIKACVAKGITHFITALGNPAEIAKAIHDHGGTIMHDVTSLRFAEKAITAGVDGLVCIGSGGGGHSGTLNALAFLPQVRALWDGLIVFAGSVSTGSAIRAAEVLGADLVYLGTRFIATQESLAPPEYKDMLTAHTSADLAYTPAITGVPANWLRPSLESRGIAIDTLTPPKRTYEHLPEGIRPWRDLWSAGQGIDLIDDVPDVASLVARLRREYVEACAAPDMAHAAAHA